MDKDELKLKDKQNKSRSLLGSVFLLVAALVCLGLLVSVVLLGPWNEGADNGSGTPSPPKNVVECLQNLDIEVLFPNSTGYNLTYQFQLVSPIAPMAVATPIVEEDVADILTCARLSSDAKVSTLGGQHSFVGYGLGNAGNLVINVENLNGVDYNDGDGTVTFGAGARVGPVAKYLWYNHGRLVPHVRGASVGMVGSFIGGGFGITSRYLGSPAYNLVSVRYMLPNGMIVESNQDSDLLFAAQGAGASFGVILSMTSKTWEPISPSGVSYNFLSDGDLEPEEMVAVIVAVQEFALSPDMPTYSSLRVHLGNSLRLSGTYFGSDFQNEMAIPMINFVNETTGVIPEVPETGNRALVEGDPWDVEIATTGSAINATNGGTVGVRAFYTQSLAFNYTLDADLISSILDNVVYSDVTVDGLRKGGFLDFWGNGVFENIEDSDMSLQQGNNVWLLRVDGRTTTNYAVYEPFSWPEGSEEFMQSVMAPVEELILEKGLWLRGFANYRDRMLTEAEWSERLYGINYDRLLEIKDRYDPTGMFTSNDQCIPN